MQNLIKLKCHELVYRNICVTDDRGHISFVVVPFRPTMLPMYLDCPFLIALIGFSPNIYLD
jgi:hypothetical protein